MEKRMIDTGLTVLFFLWSAVLIATCAGCGFCQVKANKATATCKAERVITECGPGAVGIFAQAMVMVLAQDYTAAIELVVKSATGAEAQCIKDAIDSTIADAVRRGAPPAMIDGYRRARLSNEAKK